VSHRKYTIKSFECKDCSNNCSISKVDLEGEKPLFYGSRCEKYEVDRNKKQKKTGEYISNGMLEHSHALPDLFAERERWLLESLQHSKVKGPRIGIPWILIFHEQFPFWQRFFEELDLEVVLSDRTTKEIIRTGVESAVAETCFPVKVAHGHVLNLVEKDVDAIFIPSVTEIKSEYDIPESVTCPYVQASPYLM